MIRTLALLLLLSTSGIPRRPAKVYVESYSINSFTVDRTYEQIGNPRNEPYYPEPVRFIELDQYGYLCQGRLIDLHLESDLEQQAARGAICLFNDYSVMWGWSDNTHYYLRACGWSSRTDGHWEMNTVCDTCWWPNIDDCISDTIYVLYRADDGRSSFTLGNCHPESTWVEGRY